MFFSLLLFYNIPTKMTYSSSLCHLLLGAPLCIILDVIVAADVISTILTSKIFLSSIASGVLCSYVFLL